VPFRLDGQSLYYNTGKLPLQLSAKRALFLKLLLGSPNKPVPFKSFTNAGIPYPTKLKGDLSKQLKKEGIEMVINAAPGSYTLALPEPD
jgi:hypothetical protein